MKSDSTGPMSALAPRSGAWVDRLLLSGGGALPCLHLARDVDRRTLRDAVDREQWRLKQAGLCCGGTVALRLPPSLGFIAALLAAWRLGAQVSLLDHRLTQAEVGRALLGLAPQVLVEAAEPADTALRGYAEVELVAVPLKGGRAAQSPHVLIQLTSGSAGPSKVVARTAADLEAELGRYRLLPAGSFPWRGERIVLLTSMVHVLGLVGGLLWALNSGARLVLPDRLTATGILDAVAAGAEPTTVIGVPFHAELLAAAAPRPLPSLIRMIVAGEPARPGVPESFEERYRVPLGTMYGMTELGVIATDLTGRLRPAVEPAAGLELRVDAGELHVRMPQSPYLGTTDPARWSDGWLHTRDAASLDPETGQVTILGRLDSQVSVGGLEVDLAEVEKTLCATPGVAEVVVVFESGKIEAYLALAFGATVERVRESLALEAAAYKLPQHLWVLPALPRTPTGKLQRDKAALRAAAARTQPDGRLSRRPKPDRAVARRSSKSGS